MSPGAGSGVPAEPTGLYPRMVVDLDALEHNIAVMAEWCAARGVALAPHVKTTMSEPIVRRQVAAGVGRLTVATVAQARTVLSWGHRKVLVANEVVESAALEVLRSLTEGEDPADVICLVDSLEGIEQARRVFASGTSALQVMVDVGTAGGRTGVREARTARRLAQEVHLSKGLRLVGVSGYEGVVANARDDATLRAVDEHCRRTSEIFTSFADLYETDTPIFSMGGSAFPDRVVSTVPAAQLMPGSVLLLRSGCYVTHDHGTYARTSPISGLMPAISIRATVLSTPEPGMAVLGAGKRELPHDAGMPVLLSATDLGGAPRTDAAGTVTTLFDHHAVLTGVRGLRVTDVVELGVSHPCSAFARWDTYLTTRGNRTVGIERTEFHRTA